MRSRATLPFPHKKDRRLPVRFVLCLNVGPHFGATPLHAPTAIPPQGRIEWVCLYSSRKTGLESLWKNNTYSTFFPLLLSANDELFNRFSLRLHWYHEATCFPSSFQFPEPDGLPGIVLSSFVCFRHGGNGGDGRPLVQVKLSTIAFPKKV